MIEFGSHEYVTVIGPPRYFCRWWMKTRIKYYDGKAYMIVDGKKYQLPLMESYCPIWAKPLDFIWKLIFGNPKLIQDNE